MIKPNTPLRIMISGSRDLFTSSLPFPPYTFVRQQIHMYIREFLKNHKEIEVNVGDADGVDMLANDLLSAECRNINCQRDMRVKVNVYHKGDTPRGDTERKFNYIGGFENHRTRDDAMIELSTHYLFIRAGGDTSTGTTRNIEKLRNLESQNLTIIDI